MARPLRPSRRAGRTTAWRRTTDKLLWLRASRAAASNGVTSISDSPVDRGEADEVDAGVLLSVLSRAADGDFTARVPPGWTGVAEKVANGINGIIAANQSLESELARICQVVGQQGELSQRMVVGGWARCWTKGTESINMLLDGLIRPTLDMQRVIGAVADGDLSKRVTADARGELLDLKRVVNGMVDQVSRFASEVSWVSRAAAAGGSVDRSTDAAVGTGGVWRNLTGNVNQLATNLTNQVRAIADVASAVTFTDDLLKQSQLQAETLRSQKDDLRQSYRRLEQEMRRVVDQNTESARERHEIERVKVLLAGQARHLAVSSKHQSELIANLSHELRTPLNSLLILAEQLEDDPEHSMTDAQVEYASIIRSSGQDLMKLLNTILDLAKIESGTAHLEMTDVSVAQLCADLLRQFGPVARSKGLTYTVELPVGSPETLVTDPQRLSQILRNLIGNALKFTDRGGVHVRVAPAEWKWRPASHGPAEAACFVEFTVADTGIGIDEEHQRRIFEAFVQGDGSAGRSSGGIGLGLSISRALATLLGGEISLDHSSGRGSTFAVRLPTGRPEPAEPLVHAADPRVVPLRPAPVIPLTRTALRGTDLASDRAPRHRDA